MEKVIVPKDYHTPLDVYHTQRGIDIIKQTFAHKLCEALNLKRVSAPLFVEHSTGLNDDLNGVERPVSFDIKATGRDAEIVHSLAKWKRMALKKYDFHEGTGLYTDMNAIRRDEDIDCIHSVYTDQWDWEKVININDRNKEYLKATVIKEVNAICDTLDEIKKIFPEITLELSREVSFVTTQELEDMWPDSTPHEREYNYVKAHRTAFVMEIGGKLKSGKPHDGRAPDYDDWSLNGDIIFYNELLDIAFEVSSMGIRVSPESLDRQLSEAGADDRRSMEFHRELLSGNLPYTIGGGIGQSRLCMLLLQKAHIGEVQVSVWDDETKRICENAGILLL